MKNNYTSQMFTSISMYDYSLMSWFKIKMYLSW